MTCILVLDIHSFNFFFSELFSSPEVAFLLVGTKNRDFWEGPNFGACAENLFRILSQSDRLDSEYTQSDGKSVKFVTSRFRYGGPS